MAAYKKRKEAEEIRAAMTDMKLRRKKLRELFAKLPSRKD